MESTTAPIACGFRRPYGLARGCAARRALEGRRGEGRRVQATVRVTVEIEGSDRPGCVVETISRFVPG